MGIGQAIAVISLSAAVGVNWYVAGLLQERYGKPVWLNMITGAILLWALYSTIRG